MAIRTQSIEKKEEVKDLVVSETTSSKKERRLHRSATNKVIAGVAGGIGEYFDLDPTIIRLLFILLTVFGGSGILVYIICWLIMPGSDKVNTASGDLIRQNIADMSDKARSFAHDISGTKPGEKGQNDSRFWWGFIIIILGIILLFQNLGIFDLFNFERFWPTLIILFGLILLLKKK